MADTVNCCICGAPRARTVCQVLKLTEAEKEAIRRTGVEPKDEVAYCPPCYRIITDREKGARLMQGLLHHSLQSLPQPISEKLADKFYRLLLERGRPKPVS